MYKCTLTLLDVHNIYNTTTCTMPSFRKFVEGKGVGAFSPNPQMKPCTYIAPPLYMYLV